MQDDIKNIFQKMDIQIFKNYSKDTSEDIYAVISKTSSEIIARSSTLININKKIEIKIYCKNYVKDIENIIEKIFIDLYNLDNYILLSDFENSGPFDIMNQSVHVLQLMENKIVEKIGEKYER